MVLEKWSSEFLRIEKHRTPKLQRGVGLSQTPKCNKTSQATSLLIAAINPNHILHRCQKQINTVNKIKRNTLPNQPVI